MSEIRTRLQDSTPFFPNMLNNGSVEVCLKEDVDKVIAEKDAEIALLKERICNGDVSRLTWIDDCLAKDKLIAELKQKLEDVQASAYADSVDAGMRERRLRRALYKACANWAMNARMVEIEAEPWGENHESRLWAGVYDKCLKKAEEYK